ncbi:MAG TPA: HDOD domain-containing protein [Solirubrobacteraceae bacterium]|nr:HDOD domain-containing protein [Solirubrobacteraceae bacterium]
MSDVFVARQPIFDRTLDVAGYELLFRGNDTTAEAIIASPEGATATVVLNSVTEIGLQQIVGTKCAWVNVSREFILGGLAQTLPPGLTLLEILEDQLIDEELIVAVTELKQRGYHLALDDFIYDESCEPLLELVDVVKLDLLALGRDGLSHEVARLRPYGPRLLAEKLETRDDYAYCAAAGCDLFQGYFFCRPELVRGRRIDANRLSLLEVLAALQEPDVELHTLERIIARDVGLSYRLLRYINSAFFGLRQEVRSIGQALALLGVESLTRWASLSVFASIDDKPPELTVTALIRGRFCELVGAEHLRGASHSELFTLGLFSVIDALMDTPIENVLAKIPFPPDICDALVSHQGEKGKLLECITALEAGAFDRAEELLPDAGQAYLEALSWANDAADPLFEQPASAAA